MKEETKKLEQQLFQEYEKLYKQEKVIVELKIKIDVSRSKE